jgi:hypothetical protein
MPCCEKVNGHRDIRHRSSITAPSAPRRCAATEAWAEKSEFAYPNLTGMQVSSRPLPTPGRRYGSLDRSDLAGFTRRCGVDGRRRSLLVFGRIVAHGGRNDVESQITAKMAAAAGSKPEGQIASIISKQLTEKNGRKPDSVTCPDNLKGVKGATLRCQLTEGGDKYGVNVTVTSVDGDNLVFDFESDDQPS